MSNNHATTTSTHSRATGSRPICGGVLGRDTRPANRNLRVPLASRAMLVLAVLCLSACTTIDRGAAQKLAATGVSLSSASARQFTQIESALQVYVAREYMLSALDPQKFSPPTSSMRQSIDAYSSALRLRGGVLRQLARTYQSFGELASYDASAEMEKSLDGLTGVVNALATALGAVSPLSVPAAGVITAIGGAVAQQVQSRKLKKSSELLRVLVDEFVVLLKLEKSLHQDVTQVMETSAGRAVSELLKAGI